MTDEPLKELSRAVNTKYVAMPRTGDVVVAGRRTPVSECSFHEIPPTRGMPAVAFVDGGSAILVNTPAFAATLNRLACAVFRGSKRLGDPDVPPVQFLSLLSRVRRGFAFTIYPYEDHPELLPDVESLDAAASMAAPDAGSDDAGEDGMHRLLSLPRMMGEWKMAREAVRRMPYGNCLVMDGSLSVWGPARRDQARGVMEEARRRRVIVCGLSKTSNLYLDGGRPLLDYIREEYMARQPKMPWYVDIGKPPNNPKPGDIHTMAVMLHGASRWLYRLDMDAVTRRRIGDEGTGEVLASLAANSSDAMMPGYPYGLSYADRHAQVRHDTARVFAAKLLAMLDDGPRRATNLNTQHEYLNRVTG